MPYWPLLLVAALCAIATFVLFTYSDGGMDDGAGATLCLVGSFATGISAFILVLAFALINMERAECSEHGERLNVTTAYQALTGCYVHVDGESIPYDRWIQISGANTP